MSTRKYSIIVTNGQSFEVWGRFTSICEAHDLPYHSLKTKSFPIEHGGLKLIKVLDGKKIVDPFHGKLPNVFDVKIEIQKLIIKVEELANINDNSSVEAGKQQAYSHIYFELRKMLDKLYH